MEMTTKYLEIRDKGTTIAAMGILMTPGDATEARFMRHCGFPADGSSVILMSLYDQKATNDPYEWAALGKGTRTFQIAHDYILNHWGEIQHGQVIDVECVLGEKATPKTAEIGVHANG
jgi:hypothetical protein